MKRTCATCIYYDTDCTFYYGFYGYECVSKNRAYYVQDVTKDLQINLDTANHIVYDTV